MTCNIENQFCVMLFNLWLSKLSTGITVSVSYPVLGMVFRKVK